MDPVQLLAILATAIATSTPLVLACLGETISERAGVINLSAEGTIMLGAMTGFAAAYATGQIWLGFLAAAGVGAGVALIVAFAAITLQQSQIAIGFVLALWAADLSSFLGNAFVRIPGPTVPSWKLPILHQIPGVGSLLFASDGLVYLTYLLIAISSIFFYRTRAGLVLRMIGEQPAAAFARGIPVVYWRYFYTLLGGSLLGIAGAAFSLDFKAGWSHRHTAGYGWIALAIVIFGGWDPLKSALGAYLFGILQSLASVAQSQIRFIPTQVFSVAPFVVMILVLVLTSGQWLERLLDPLPYHWRHRLLKILRSTPPAALGQSFNPDP
ncbi:MAG: ABC transporter permease [Cyanobacteriota bacterium]|nr:ABC transporter permease [Cyanobacteriota bacterium]